LKVNFDLNTFIEEKTMTKLSKRWGGKPVNKLQPLYLGLENLNYKGKTQNQKTPENCNKKKKQSNVKCKVRKPKRVKWKTF